MSEKQDSTISESFKFTGSIYRILKSQKTYFPPETFIDTAIQFNRSESTESKSIHKYQRNFFRTHM